ncbi:MAG: hypothetical protein JXA54_17075 [Candidatus Heimdallarchaeota archaeon]|nr:hypothetical protein [Candidatus Heimdallarchaeota archaeon]
MSEALKQSLVIDIRNILDISIEKKEKILQSLNVALENALKGLMFDKSLFDTQTRKFEFGEIDSSFGISFGIKRNKDTIAIGEWLFGLPKMIKMYLLYFIITKESILLYINPDAQNSVSEVEEAIANILTILMFREIFTITTFDNPMIASYRARIYPTEIFGIESHFWDSLLHLLFVKKISFDLTLKTFKEIYEKNRTSDTDILTGFQNWVFDNTIKEEDVISPIHLPERVITVIDQLINLGYEEGTSPNIAANLNLHENTVRKQIMFITDKYSAFWRAELNLEKLNLHNYFLKIKLTDEKAFDTVYNMVEKIPYLKALFREKYLKQPIIYTPTLICPHIIANTLDSKLVEFQNKGLVEEFTLQIIREKKHFASIIDKQFVPNRKIFQKLIDGDSNIPLRKYIFAQSKKEFSMQIDDDSPIDYNLLYFLSILNNKHFLRSRYGVWINEWVKLYQMNDISTVDVDTQTDFANQLEIRARKRGFLSYCFYMRSLSRQGRDISIIEIPNFDQYPEQLITETIDKIRIFSFLGQMNLYDRIILTIPGVSHLHYIMELLDKTFLTANIRALFYTVANVKSQFVPLHDLYDFDGNRWLFSPKEHQQ